MLKIAELLRLRGLDTDVNVKLVRHQDPRYDVDKLIRCDQLERYQSYQGSPVFDGCEFIVSFTGLENSKALFYGVYRVGGAGRRLSEDEARKETAFYADFLVKPEDPEPPSGAIYHYELEKKPAFEDLEGRVVIAWGAGAIAFVQYLCKGKEVLEKGNKEVLEVLPAGHVKDFTGYLDVVLAYDELVAIMKNADASRNWHTLLSAVAGVYLITDTFSGHQYVGSAYGRDGILGRWKQYADDPTGGTVALKALLEGKDDSYKENLQFTILQTLPRTLTNKEVIGHEWRYKKKLGPKAVALNPEPKADALDLEPKADALNPD